MGAWGYGILQNDTAQDGMCDAAERSHSMLPGFAENPGPDTAARLAATVGMCLQFSRYLFDADSPSHAQLLQAIEANRQYLAQLPGKAESILLSVLDGQGLELADRGEDLPDDLEKAFRGFDPSNFPTQKIFGERHGDLFQHPESARFTQEFVDRLVKQVDEGFADEDMLDDLAREGDFMGPLGLLLIIEPCKIDSKKFAQWRKQFQDVWKNLEPRNDEMEIKFEASFRPCVELALDYGFRKFSK